MHHVRGQRYQGADGWLQPRRRRAEAEWTLPYLRRGRHPRHGTGASRPGEGASLHRIPAGAGCRPCGCGCRLSHAAPRDLPDRLRARISERPGGAGERDDRLLSDDPDEWLERSRDHRPPAGGLRGARPARGGPALRQGSLPGGATGGYRGRRCASHPRGALRETGWSLSGPARQGPQHHGGREGGARVDLPRRGSGSRAGARSGVDRSRARPARAGGAAAPRAWQGRGVRRRRGGHQDLRRGDRHPVSADVDGERALAGRSSPSRPRRRGRSYSGTPTS